MKNKFYKPTKSLSHLLFPEVQLCKNCKLSKVSINLEKEQGKMAGAGKLNADFLVLGLAPSCHRKGEIKFGVPFNLFDEELYSAAVKNERKKLVGNTSKLRLLRLIEGAGLKKTSCYITNLIKCSTQSDNKPSHDELLTCYTTFLIREIETIKPILIIGLGTTVRDFFGANQFNKEYIGRNISFFFTYHPGYYLHSGNLDALRSSVSSLRMTIKLLQKRKNESKRL